MERELIVNRERIVSEFQELTAIDALSLQEREIADVVMEKLRLLGCEVEEDDTAGSFGGSCGNILARLPAYAPEGCADGPGEPDGHGEPDGPGEPDGHGEPEPILLAAHLDTVGPGRGKQARLCDDGRIEGNGRAVLGADDVTGIVEILEGMRILREQRIPHRPVEILFTVSEESYGRGSRAMDLSKLRSKELFVFDLTGPIGSAAVRAPSLLWFKITVTGRSAHAGFSPEQGINAVRIAAKAVARLPQGRLDEDTTFNIGSIEGGKASNIVPDRCELTGEVRSTVHERTEEVFGRVKEIFGDEAERAGGEVSFEARHVIRAYHTPEDSPVCRRFREAVRRLGLEPEKGDVFVTTRGGSDNNVFAERGLEGIVVASGMYEPHSLQEYTTVRDLIDGAKLAAALCMI